MKMRLLFAGLTLAALTIAASPAHAKNVLLLVADDLGVDKVSSYAADYPGYTPRFLPNTRAIDDLAANGIRFTRAWAMPLCSPTRASFQTGMFPFHHGIGTALPDDDPGLDDGDFTTLAESFVKAGYATGYFGKWHIGVGGPVPVGGRVREDVSPLDPSSGVPPHPVLAGWERFFGALGGEVGNYEEWTYVSWPHGIDELGSGTERKHATTRTAEVALDWIIDQANQPTPTPWLAVVAFNAPHSPNSASSSWKYGDQDPDGLHPGRYRSDLTCLEGTPPDCGLGGSEARAVYQALVEYMDLVIEKLLKDMEDAGVLDDTLILFFGDNGTPHEVQEGAFFDFDLHGPDFDLDIPDGDPVIFAATSPGQKTVDHSRGKNTTYENGIRVPLIAVDGKTLFNGPTGAILTPGRIVEAEVNITDVFETVRVHADPPVDSVPGVDSRSFTDCFTTTDVHCGWGSRYDYSETFKLDENGSLLSAQIAVRYGHEKMVAKYDPDHTDGPCMETEFYETPTNDPFETVLQTWPVGDSRGDRLRDHFTVTLHPSWAIDPAATGDQLFPYCPS